MGVSKVLGIVPMEERIVASDIARYKLVRKDWFAYNPMRLNIGSIARWHGDADILVSPDYVVFQCRDEPDSGIAPSYLDHFRQSAAWDAFVSEGGDGGVRVRIHYKDIARLELALPARAEQQKIADCLSSLDELIAAQQRKVEALKTYKRGLMQQLFPREGETLPRLRFPEFRDAPEWNEHLLSNISPAIYDGTHQTPTYTSEGVPFYSVENLISGNANKFISHDDYLEATRKNRPQKDDILLTRIGKIGHSTVVTWDHEFSVYVTLAVIQRAPSFNSHYMHYCMQSERYQSELRAKSLPNAVPPKINLDSLRTTKVLVPLQDEQQRIATCLSGLDDQISAEFKMLDTFKTHKAGLMQQLFPSLEEA